MRHRAQACWWAVVLAGILSAGCDRVSDKPVRNPDLRESAREQETRAEWQGRLDARIKRIDDEMPGDLGIYVKRLDSGGSVGYRADRP